MSLVSHGGGGGGSGMGPTCVIWSRVLSVVPVYQVWHRSSVGHHSGHHGVPALGGARNYDHLRFDRPDTRIQWNPTGD